MNNYYEYKISVQHNLETEQKHYILMDGEDVIFSSFDLVEIFNTLAGYENE